MQLTEGLPNADGVGLLLWFVMTLTMVKGQSSPGRHVFSFPSSSGHLLLGKTCNLLSLLKAAISTLNYFPLQS